MVKVPFIIKNPHGKDIRRGEMAAMAEVLSFEFPTGRPDPDVCEISYKDIRRATLHKALFLGNDRIQIFIKGNETPDLLPDPVNQQFEVETKKKYRDKAEEIVREVQFTQMSEDLDEMLDMTNPLDL